MTKRTYKKGGIIHSERKVRRVGNSLVVTLPSDWAKEHNIQPGDKIIQVANSIITMVMKPKE